MRQALAKIKPKKGFAHLLHVLFSAALPALIYVLVRMGFSQLALAVVLIGKWRMLAVRPRFWLANIRANAVDLIVAVSTILFMTHSSSASWQITWALLLVFWQLVIKPRRGVGMVALQALIGQTYGLMAVFTTWPDIPLIALVAVGWAICYLSARHYMSSFDETYTSLYSHFWGYFAAALMWLSSHWLIYYSVMPQPVLLLTVLGFGLGCLYYLSETDRLSIFLRRQIVFIMLATISIVLVFSDWSYKLK